MVTNHLPTRTLQLFLAGLTVPIAVGVLASSRTLMQERLLLGTWSSPAASLTAEPGRAGLVLPCLKVRFNQPLRLDDSLRFDATGIIVGVPRLVPRRRGDRFPLSGQLLGDRLVIHYPWIMQSVGADTLTRGYSDVSGCH